MKKTAGNEIQPRRSRAARLAPEETASFLPEVRIELLGSREATVDGCRGIVEYTESCIRLGSARHIIRFCGSGLIIRCFDDGGAVVTGEISSVEFC